MELPVYVVDAFCRGAFTGNPAAVVPLSDWLPDAVLGAIARQHNLSETAFIVGGGERRALRWFTPAVEVALCGHATLGAAHVIMSHLHPGIQRVVFTTRRSGELVVERVDACYEMALPALVPEACADAAEVAVVAAALQRAPERLLAGAYSAGERDLVAVFAAPGDVAALAPNMAAIAALDARGVICTAPGDDVDFVSRYFAPRAGVPEDPVTGSAHCLLAPFWSQALGRTELSARQLSDRGGWLRCAWVDQRVLLTGAARTYLEGRVWLE